MQVTAPGTTGRAHVPFRGLTRFVAVPATWLAVTVALAGCEPDGGGADLILTGAAVYTLDWGEPGPDGTPAADAPYTASDGWRPDAEAVAIADGRIVFVGSSDDAMARAGAETRVVELNGATVLPGLVDSHTHVAGLGANLERVDLLGVETEAEAVDRLAQRASATPAGDWIVGWGWDEGAWANRYPDAEAVSERIPDHPVVAQSLHGFAVWGNRLALERAGIGPGTTAPVGGEILTGPGGEPTGILLNRATVLLTNAIPAPTPDQMRRRVRAGLEEMARSGFTAVHEAGSSREIQAALDELAAAGDLPVRVYSMLSGRDPDLMDEWLARGPETDPEDLLWTRSVKAYYDGALGSRGARLLDDYSDQPGHRGVSGEGYGFDETVVATMMRAGFQTGVHAIGDAGNRETLDFYERVFEASPEAREHRHRIEHAQVLHPDDIPRFAELSVIASMEPPHAVEDMVWAEERLGPVRIRGAYAWRSLRETGARLIFNSDLAGSDHDIFYGLHAAITRRNKERMPTEGWYPGQRMTGEEAVRAYTAWAAYASFVEDRGGVLAPGRWADLSVLTVDPLRLAGEDAGAVLDGAVVMTVVAGRIAYER